MSKKVGRVLRDGFISKYSSFIFSKYVRAYEKSRNCSKSFENTLKIVEKVFF